MSQNKIDRAATVYGFVRAYLLEFDCAPNYREISSACGIALRQVNRILRQLVEEGRLVHTPRRARAVSLPHRHPFHTTHTPQRREERPE